MEYYVCKYLLISDGNYFTMYLSEVIIYFFYRAKADLDKFLSISHEWTDFCDSLDKKKVIQAPFCGEISCEEKIKKDSARYSIFLQFIHNFS